MSVISSGNSEGLLGNKISETKEIDNTKPKNFLSILNKDQDEVAAAISNSLYFTTY
jgi:N-acetylmuramic acid 6-phosphate (MurNAc-6-P) etherase